MTLRVVRMVEERFHRDEEDRPIREGRTPPEHLREGDIEYRTCPYAGSRFQHPNPMNVSALRQASAHWDEVLDALAYLRAAHDQIRGVTAPGIWDIWRTSQLGSALPWFFLFRGERVPAYAAALAKMTLGMGIWAQRVFASGGSPGSLTAPSILALAEANGTLVGDTEVCAGSEKMLLRYFDVHVTASPGPGGLAAPREDLLRFAAHYANFKLVVWIYYLARRALYADVAAQHGDSPALAELRSCGVEPSDFFIVEGTGDRQDWFSFLADFVVPLSPDRADAPLREHAFAMAAAMGTGRPPQQVWTELDDRFGRVVAAVEAGFSQGRAEDIEVPADVRDRLIGASPRALFASLPNAARR